MHDSHIAGVHEEFSPSPPPPPKFLSRPKPGSQTTYEQTNFSRYLKQSKQHNALRKYRCGFQPPFLLRHLGTDLYSEVPARKEC